MGSRYNVTEIDDNFQLLQRIGINETHLDPIGAWFPFGGARNTNLRVKFRNLSQQSSIFITNCDTTMFETATTFQTF